MVEADKITLDTIANSVKVSQGSCKESSLEILKMLASNGLTGQMLFLPNHNHVVVGLDNYIIDPAMGIDYCVGNGEKVFERKQHKKIMQEIASKEPFCLYMSKEVVYRPVNIR